MSTETSEAAAGRIVVGVDGSTPSKQALLWAQFLAQATGASIQAIAAWEVFSGWAALGAGWTAMPDDWNPAGDAEQALGATLDDVFGDHRPAGLTADVREGSAAKVLLEASEGASILVVGSRGHGGFSGLLLGSVSAACAEHANCPVLVLHGETPPPS